MGLDSLNNPFSNLFDIENQDIAELVIKETLKKDNCFIYKGSEIIGGFILINKPNVKTILKVSFYKSKVDNKYLPRLEFRKEDNKGNLTKSRGHDVIVKFSDGDEARAFWKAIHFLQGFKELVDLGDFHSKYQAISFDSYLVDFKSKGQAEKFKELYSLTENIKLSKLEIKELLFPQRRNTIHWFYAFLKDLQNNEGKKAFDSYRNKHSITENGEEAIWHHFFKNNDWIIGLNVDIKFIRDLLSKQRIGSANSKGVGSPEVDLLGISYFITLIELKTSKTKIFRSEKSSKSRANTWDFSNDFIEAYSQTLSQRSEISETKNIEDEDGIIIDTKKHRILDPKAVLIIGNRNEEFPHIRKTEYDVKTDCFERIRRDSRNIEIITFDELFERAFHIVFSEKLPENWYNINPEDFKKDILKVD
ncbi:DUF4263 domain-containing protein [candidate division KSB1 bacterium]|nr:DUF4263 domain-containing protein [candidate division KSB1 bacterium]